MLDTEKLINAVSKAVEKELNSPTEKLLSIRKQLQEGKDVHGNDLETFELDMDEESIDALYKYAKDHNATFEEVAWLFIQSLLEEDKMEV